MNKSYRTTDSRCAIHWVQSIFIKSKTALAVSILGMLALLGQTAVAASFTFSFDDAFDFVGPSWPGANTFHISITVDNGGATPVGSFNLDDLQKIVLLSGAYQSVWDASAGGVNSSSTPDFWTISYDGSVATWVMADIPFLSFGSINLQGGTDNQVGATTVGYVGSKDEVDNLYHIFVITSLSNSNDFHAFFNGVAPNSIEGTLVPVPPAVWLFGSALGLLGWMRRKAA